MSDILNSIDTELHEAIHADMERQHPSKILLNPRTNILKTLKGKIGNLHGTIADIGCGNGYLSIFMAKRYRDIIKIDAIEGSEQAVTTLLPRNIDFHGMTEKVNPVLANFDQLEEQKYDFVFAMGSIHHSKNLQETSNSIYRSLKKGGVLVAQEPAMPDYTTHSEYEEKYNIIENRFGLTIKNGDRFDRFFRECEYKSALIKSGFDIIMWSDYKNRGFQKLVKLCFSALKHTVISKKFFTENNKDNWRSKMKKMTKNVKPKIIIAKKPLNGEIYH